MCNSNIHIVSCTVTQMGGNIPVIIGPGPTH